MAYQLRFESNAFRADSAIGKLLDTLGRFQKTVKRAVGVKVQEYQGNELRQLRGINQRTFYLAMDWADADFDQQMTEEKWQWRGPNNPTRRKNGEVVTEPRNIVDLGTLLQSKQRIEQGRGITEFVWTDEKAELVHDGGSLRNGGVYPARPWTEPTLEEIEEVIDNMLRRGGR